MLKKLAKNNSKAQENLQQIEATTRKMKEELSRKQNDQDTDGEEGECIEEELVPGDNKFVEMVQFFQQQGWIGQNINPDAFSVSIQSDNASHFNLYEFKILFGIWLKYYLENTIVIEAPQLMKEFYRLCPAFGPKHPNFKFMQSNIPLDQQTVQVQNMAESIPVPREAKTIGKNLDWIRGNFYINFALKKKYTPTSEYEKNYFTFETKMSISIKRNNFGNRSVYLSFDLPEHFDDFCKTRVLKAANDNMKDPKVYAEIVKNLIQAIEQTPQGLQTVSNRISSSPIEIKKGKH